MSRNMQGWAGIGLGAVVLVGLPYVSSLSTAGQWVAAIMAMGVIALGGWLNGIGRNT